MKHKIPGVTDELLLRAREEFLKEGFQGANLRKIAMAAGVSTNSIYSRFSDKKGLFDAIVKETADEFAAIITDMNKISESGAGVEEALDKSNSYTLEALDYVYDHFDVFKLIFCKSVGTEYEHYIDKLSENEEESYRVYLKSMGLEDKVNDLFIHVICQAGYRYLMETVANDLSKDEAREFMIEVLKFMDAGFEAVLGQ